MPDLDAQVKSIVGREVRESGVQVLLGYCLDLKNHMSRLSHFRVEHLETKLEVELEPRTLWGGVPIPVDAMSTKTMLVSSREML